MPSWRTTRSSGSGESQRFAFSLTSHRRKRILPSFLSRDAEIAIPHSSMYSAVRYEMQIEKDLVAASATPLVLAILDEGESYGYAIMKRVRQLSDGELEWTDGMLYPLLHRLHRLGYVTRDWRRSPEGRRRRYYAITESGRVALADHKRQWSTVSRALSDLWGGTDLLAFGYAGT